MDTRLDRLLNQLDALETDRRRVRMAWGAVSYADVPGIGQDDLLAMTQAPVEIASIPIRDDAVFGHRPVFSAQLGAAAGTANAPSPSSLSSRPGPGAVVETETSDLVAGLNRGHGLMVDTGPDDSADAEPNDHVHGISTDPAATGDGDGTDDSDNEDGEWPAASFDLPGYDATVSTEAYDDKTLQPRRLIRVTNTGDDDIDSAAEPDTSAVTARGPLCRDPLTAKVALPAIDVDSIMRAKETFGRFVRRTSLCDPATANPWILVERLSETILDECLLDVSREIGVELDAVVDTMVAGELKVA